MFLEQLCTFKQWLNIRKDKNGVQIIFQRKKRMKMKQSNFPARKIQRQLRAQGIDITNDQKAKAAISDARGIRTKKSRAEKGKRNG